MGKVAVVGDLMLDKYDYCLGRDNPESSAPCYTVQRTEYKPGGAGNVASGLAVLGDDVCLVSVGGVDESSRILRGKLVDAGVDYRVIGDSSRTTIVKERVMSATDGRYHFRKDVEAKKYIDDNHVREIMSRVSRPDLIVVSDYNKGVISGPLMDELKRLGVPIIVDPKPNHKDFYKGVFLVTPNVKEARDMSGLENVVDAGVALSKSLGSNVLLTRSQDGVSFFGSERFDFPTEAKKVFDVTGAGDTVVAVFAHYYMKGLPLRACVRLANKAAGIAVSYPGCYLVSEKEIQEA
jgi:rfaE bifunctional protein kinase chain/domain